MGSSLPAGGYIDKPLTVSEQVALANQRLNEQKYLSSLIQPASGSSSGRSSTTSRSSSSGGGSGGGGSDYNLADKLAYLDASTNATGSLAQQEFDLKKELLLLQFQLDNDPNNPQLLLKQQELAEDVRQFNATLALQQKAQQNETAKTIADYGANPGDAVAREYFLRQGANPTGNAVNIFTGQPTGQQNDALRGHAGECAACGRYLAGADDRHPSPSDRDDRASTTPRRNPPVRLWYSSRSDTRWLDKKQTNSLQVIILWAVRTLNSTRSMCQMASPETRVTPLLEDAGPQEAYADVRERHGRHRPRGF